MKNRFGWLLLIGFLAMAASAQEIPADYQEVLKYLGKRGDYKASGLKINIPRNDLEVTVAGVATPTPFGFGGWLGMTKGDGGQDVMMGDLVLLEDKNGLEVVAIHHHMTGTRPVVIFLHYWGRGPAERLAAGSRAALDELGKK